MIDITKIIIQLLTTGPTRVVYNEHGDAMPPERALALHSARPDTVFIRKDGWSAGAPKQYEEVLENLWFNDWVFKIDLKALKLNLPA